MNPVYEWFLERSAILQFDGQMIQADADYCAYALTAAYCERTGQSMPNEGYLGRLRPPDRLVWDDAMCSIRVVKPRPDWVIWTSNDKEGV
ncbi:hypothetical protein [Paraburkholderia sp. J11-2]|uniref:hypothetical protein n=1 Tax=Paraburkholderia sp. J11-2 TaxID=2805431 RepID=UPI002AB6AB58|nr:hypothetical protein [Paraburkholderia sp. J11-2]